MREALRLEEALDVNRPGLADAREVVPAEVDEHHVLGAVLLRGEQLLDVAGPARNRARDRVHARAAVLDLDERLRRGADQRELAELEQEEVRRRVDAAQRAVDVDRRRAGRPLRALREDDLERVALADVLLRALDAADVLEPSRRAARPAARPVAARLEPGQRPVEPLRHLDRVAAQDLGHPQDVVELDERVGDDEQALGKVRAGARAAARSARASRCGRSRGSRRRARRAPRPPRTATIRVP